jgi:hypothetical protein
MEHVAREKDVPVAPDERAKVRRAQENICPPYVSKYRHHGLLPQEPRWRGLDGLRPQTNASRRLFPDQVAD